jgi:hypothetical protein
MYAVIRTYLGTGAKQLFELLEERSADVEATFGQCLASSATPCSIPAMAVLR